MLVSQATVAFFALAVPPYVHYFSREPGQGARATTVPPVHELPSTYEAAEPTQLSNSSVLDLNRILISEPQAASINIVNKVTKEVPQPTIWDERVVFITDENYEKRIVNEPMSREEEGDRVWAIIVYVSCYEYPSSRADFIFIVLSHLPSKNTSHSSSTRSLTRPSTNLEWPETSLT